MSQAELNRNAAVTPAPTDAAAAGVRGAIARAAQATGVDFSYLLAQARLESSLDPQARATASSAAGLYQFTKGTWGTMLARHGSALGLDPSASASLPASRSHMMALRYDPNAAAMMAAELAGDNTAALTAVLGRAPTSSELYLAHFLGAGGATRFLGALATDPSQSAAALLPKAAVGNSGVFYDPAGAPRSVGAVMALIQTRMDGALQDGGQDVGAPDAGDLVMASDRGGVGAPAVIPFAAGPVAQQFTATQASGDPAAAPGTGDATSMSDTLRSTFGLAGEGVEPGAAPAFVRSAYGRMQAFGL